VPRQEVALRDFDPSSGERAARPDFEMRSIVIAAATDRMGGCFPPTFRSLHLEMNDQRFV
jgi:hypothetical protein